MCRRSSYPIGQHCSSTCVVSNGPPSEDLVRARMREYKVQDFKKGEGGTQLTLLGKGSVKRITALESTIIEHRLWRSPLKLYFLPVPAHTSMAEQTKCSESSSVEQLLHNIDHTQIHLGSPCAQILHQTKSVAPESFSQSCR